MTDYLNYSKVNEKEVIKQRQFNFKNSIFNWLRTKNFEKIFDENLQSYFVHEQYLFKSLKKRFNEKMEYITFILYYIQNNFDINKDIFKIIMNFNSEQELDSILHVLEGDRVNKVHGEMRIFNLFIEKEEEKASSNNANINQSTKKYFCITKLCCAMCNYTIQQFKNSTYCSIVPETRGYHGGTFFLPLFPKLKEENYLKIFLGEKLFDKSKEYIGDEWDQIYGMIHNLTNINDQAVLDIINEKLDLQGDSKLKIIEKYVHEASIFYNKK